MEAFELLLEALGAHCRRHLGLYSEVLSCRALGRAGVRAKGPVRAIARYYVSRQVVWRRE